MDEPKQLPLPNAVEKRPIRAAAREYRHMLRAACRSPIHCHNTWAQIRKVCRLGGVRWVEQLSERRVQKALGRLREEKHLSLVTLQHHWRSIKTFSAWLARPAVGLLVRDPLQYLPGYRIDRERHRHRRHVWTGDEVRALVHAAEIGGQHHGMSGMERSLLYRVLVESGIRPGSLYALSRDAFRMEPLPHLVVRGDQLKEGGEGRAVFLRDDTAQLLGRHVLRSGACPTLFAMPPAYRWVHMLRRDLRAAGLAPKDSEGRYLDLYSLKTTCLSNWAVAPKMTAAKLQRLAGHSNIATTLKYYVQVGDPDLADAINSMPSIFDLTDGTANGAAAAGGGPQ